jgi:hypothetical protein
MGKSLPDKHVILDAIRRVAQKLGRPPSRAEFKANSGTTEYQVLLHFPNWREAVRAAGLRLVNMTAILGPPGAGPDPLKGTSSH